VSVHDWSLKETQYAVVSIKTTGLTHGYDRICEISVVSARPSQPLQLALDSLVHPGRRLAGAEIHGITDANVSSAPTFAQVALDLVRELQGRVLVGHNLDFTLRFLRSEFETLGVPFDVPYIDTMNLASMLSQPPNRPLLQACDHWDIEPSLEPTAAAAALDSAKLMRKLLAKVSAMGLNTFGELKGKEKYAFQRSMTSLPLRRDFSYGLTESVVRASRHKQGVTSSGNVALALYWDALLVALDDLVITDEESEHLGSLQAELGLTVDDIYLLHSRVFAGSLVGVVHRGQCTAAEREHLASLQQCLHRLGWAPGDPEDESPTQDE